jgi:hypothetical protein
MNTGGLVRVRVVNEFSPLLGIFRSTKKLNGLSRSQVSTIGNSHTSQYDFLLTPSSLLSLCWLTLAPYTLRKDTKHLLEQSTSSYYWYDGCAGDKTQTQRCWVTLYCIAVEVYSQTLTWLHCMQLYIYLFGSFIDCSRSHESHAVLGSHHVALDSCREARRWNFFLL